MSTTTPVRAFTLVETMVAIAIIAISIVGPLYALEKGVIASYAARDKLAASALAQEGVEYVHGIRDSNYLYNLGAPIVPRSWLYGLDGTGGPNCVNGGACVIDAITPTNTVTACSSPSTCPPLRLSAAGVYTQASNGSNVASKFTRTVALTSVGSDGREMKVTVTVKWKTGLVNYSVSVSENLQNWL